LFLILANNINKTNNILLKSMTYSFHVNTVIELTRLFSMKLLLINAVNIAFFCVVSVFYN